MTRAPFSYFAASALAPPKIILPSLTAMAALRADAGYVTLAAPEETLPVFEQRRPQFRLHPGIGRVERQRFPPADHGTVQIAGYRQ